MIELNPSPQNEKMNKKQFRKSFLLGLVYLLLIAIIMGVITGLTRSEYPTIDTIIFLIYVLYSYDISVKRFRDIGDKSPNKTAFYIFIPIIGIFVLLDLLTKESNSKNI